jgi:hypothetical protein
LLSVNLKNPGSARVRPFCERGDLVRKENRYVCGRSLKANPQLDQKSGLGIYCASENPKQGYLVTQRDADFAVARLKGIDTTFLKIPAFILCYLLGQSERLLWG